MLGAWCSIDFAPSVLDAGPGLRLWGTPSLHLLPVRGNNVVSGTDIQSFAYLGFRLLRVRDCCSHPLPNVDEPTYVLDRRERRIERPVEIRAEVVVWGIREGAIDPLGTFVADLWAVSSLSINEFSSSTAAVHVWVNACSAST